MIIRYVHMCCGPYHALSALGDVGVSQEIKAVYKNERCMWLRLIGLDSDLEL